MPSDGPDMREVARWLVEGDVGISSKTIIAEVCRFRYHDSDVPFDFGDWKRCVLMLESCPSVAARFREVMGDVPSWSQLVARWDDMIAIADRHCPGWRTEAAAWSETVSAMVHRLNRAPSDGPGSREGDER